MRGRPKRLRLARNESAEILVRSPTSRVCTPKYGEFFSRGFHVAITCEQPNFCRKYSIVALVRPAADAGRASGRRKANPSLLIGRGRVAEPDLHMAARPKRCDTTLPVYKLHSLTPRRDCASRFACRRFSVLIADDTQLGRKRSHVVGVEVGLLCARMICVNAVETQIIRCVASSQ